MKKQFSDEDLSKSLSLYYLNGNLKKKPIAKYHKEIDDSALHQREKYRKKVEVLLLNSFLHHFPDAQFENLTCESPDFVARIQDKTIGIELTEVINHLEIKKMESLLNKIFRMAEIILEEENTPNYRGVYFLVLSKLSQDELLLRQAEIIEDICKSIRKNKPKGLVRSIRKSAHRRNVFITCDYDIGLFDDLHSEKIIDLIHKKNEKYPYYDRSTDECWLVMVSDMNSLASRYNFIENKEDLKKVESPFNKIFHLENLFGSITLIK